MNLIKSVTIVQIDPIWFTCQSQDSASDLYVPICKVYLYRDSLIIICFLTIWIESKPVAGLYKPNKTNFIAFMQFEVAFVLPNILALLIALDMFYSVSVYNSLTLKYFLNVILLHVRQRCLKSKCTIWRDGRLYAFLYFSDVCFRYVPFNINI